MNTYYSLQDQTNRLKRLRNINLSKHFKQLFQKTFRNLRYNVVSNIAKKKSQEKLTHLYFNGKINL